MKYFAKFLFLTIFLVSSNFAHSAGCTAHYWQALDSSTLSWSKLAESDHQPKNVALGDFVGDSKTDVFVKSGSQWMVSESGTGAWVKLASSGFNLGSLRFGDFVGDSKTDVFVSSNGEWKISESGTGAWIKYNTSGHKVANLRFADIVGDGKTDVLVYDDGKWLVSDSAKKSWSRLINSNVGLEGVKFGNFVGDSTEDIFAIKKKTLITATGTALIQSEAINVAKSQWQVITASFWKNATSKGTPSCTTVNNCGGNENITCYKCSVSAIPCS